MLIAQRSAAFAVVAIFAAAAPLGGCGTLGGTPNPAPNTLTIYSSLPLQGPDHDRQLQIVDGEKLALAQAGGRIGRFHVGLVSLDDADAAVGTWTPAATSQAARVAAQDKTAIAYIGDFDSAATAISLPLINGAGILQISPASPYVGLSQADPNDGSGEPDRYYPTGKRTFGRLVPSDAVEAKAMVRFARTLGVRKLFVLDDLDVFNANVATEVAKLAPSSGITVAGQLFVDTRLGATAADYQRTAASVAAQQPDAVLLGAVPDAGAAALWSALHTALPGAKLLAASTLAAPSFLHAIGPAAASTYVTSPALEPRSYPPAAQQVLRGYRSIFGVPGTPYALYGYEAMRLALDLIREAGRHGGDQRSIVRAFFRVRNRDSVLGRYSIQPSGEPTLANLAGYRVDAGGRLPHIRALSGP